MRNKMKLFYIVLASTVLKFCSTSQKIGEGCWKKKTQKIWHKFCPKRCMCDCAEESQVPFCGVLEDGRNATFQSKCEFDCVSCSDGSLEWIKSFEGDCNHAAEASYGNTGSNGNMDVAGVSSNDVQNTPQLGQPQESSPLDISPVQMQYQPIDSQNPQAEPAGILGIQEGEPLVDTQYQVVESEPDIPEFGQPYAPNLIEPLLGYFSNQSQYPQVVNLLDTQIPGSRDNELQNLENSDNGTLYPGNVNSASQMQHQIPNQLQNLDTLDNETQNPIQPVTDMQYNFTDVPQNIGTADPVTQNPDFESTIPQLAPMEYQIIDQAQDLNITSSETILPNNENTIPQVAQVQHQLTDLLQNLDTANQGTQDPDFENTTPQVPSTMQYELIDQSPNLNITNNETIVPNNDNITVDVTQISKHQLTDLLQNLDTAEQGTQNPDFENTTPQIPSTMQYELTDQSPNLNVTNNETIVPNNDNITVDVTQISKHQLTDLLQNLDTAEQGTQNPDFENTTPQIPSTMQYELTDQPQNLDILVTENQHPENETENATLQITNVQYQVTDISQNLETSEYVTQFPDSESTISYTTQTQFQVTNQPQNLETQSNQPLPNTENQYSVNQTLGLLNAQIPEDTQEIANLGTPSEEPHTPQSTDYPNLETVNNTTPYPTTEGFEKQGPETTTMPNFESVEPQKLGLTENQYTDKKSLELKSMPNNQYPDNKNVTLSTEPGSTGSQGTESSNLNIVDNAVTDPETQSTDFVNGETSFTTSSHLEDQQDSRYQVSEPQGPDVSTYPPVNGSITVEFKYSGYPIYPQKQ